MARASGSRTARKLVGALILAALACLTLGFLFKPEPPPRLVPPSPADLARQKLQQIISLDVTDQPLKDVLADMERKHGLRIELDVAALVNSGLSPAQHVTLRLHDARLGNAIELLLLQLEPKPSAGYAIVGDAIRITSVEEADQLVVTKFYHVAPWLAVDPAFSEDELAAAIYPIAGETKVLPGALAATRPERVQDEVSELLDAIARVADAPFAPPPKEPSPAEAAIARALTERADFDFEKKPLSQALAELAKRHQINIVMDPARLAEANVPPRTPVTARAGGASLRSALKRMMYELGLDFLTEHDAIVVTSKEFADTRLVPRVYEVQDLMTRESPTSPDNLAGFITDNVRPDSWKEAGGPGTITPVPRGFVVDATARMHEELAGLLDWLRRALE